MKYKVSIPIFFNPNDWVCKLNPTVSITTIETWLHYEFGMINGNWDWEWKSECGPGLKARSRANVVIFRFENEEDKIKFILRWL